MGHRLSRRAVALATATVALWAAAPTHGALPLIAGLGKQLVQNLLIDGIKSQLIGSLSGMGCKGAALASVLSGGKGAVAGMLGGALLPGGMAMPSAWRCHRAWRCLLGWRCLQARCPVRAWTHR